MARYRLSLLAEQDLQAILAWTQEQFGERGRNRYEALLVRAILDVAADPQRTGCKLRPELAPGALTYHLLHSRDHIPKATGRVRNPRHFLLFRISQDGCLDIGRVLHDSMELERHLPHDFV